MINASYQKYILMNVLLIFSVVVNADDKNDILDNIQSVYQLSYIEREPGVDDYEISMLVSDRFIRVDEAGEDSGFIIYDDKDKAIYSVSHADQSVLVIKEHVFSEKNSPVKPEIEYLELADAPTVSGQNIYNYRIYIGEGANEETCTEIQLVENILPEVRKLLRNYQNIVSGQQVKMVDNKITDIQTACYYADQIYNTGAYYEKGLPIQEWHSNERSKVLVSYKKVNITKDKFNIPVKYRQFSVGNNSKKLLE